MAVVHYDCGDDSLAVCILCVLVFLVGREHSWPAKVGHVFRVHGEGLRWWVFKAKSAREVKICFEKGVKTEVGPQAGSIVGVCYVIVIPVDNADIPTHKTHLKAEDGGVGTVIQKDEFDSITVGYPYKTLTKKNVATLVHGPVTCKSFTQL
jgi:hypothetical protein